MVRLALADGNGAPGPAGRGDKYGGRRYTAAAAARVRSSGPFSSPTPDASSSSPLLPAVDSPPLLLPPLLPLSKSACNEAKKSSKFAKRRKLPKMDTLGCCDC